MIALDFDGGFMYVYAPITYCKTYIWGSGKIKSSPVIPLTTTGLLCVTVDMGATSLVPISTDQLNTFKTPKFIT